MLRLCMCGSGILSYFHATDKIFDDSGGGIGGLAFAVALAKTGAALEVDIYESTASFGEIGAGIGLWPRVWNTLVSLGLEEDLKAGSTTLKQGW